MKTAFTCKDVQIQMPDLLFEQAPASTRPALAIHLAACQPCRTELGELRSTFAALDSWSAPAPTAFFEARMQAKLRTAVASPPETLLERFRSYLLFSTGRSFRPALAGALGAVLILAGGSFAGVHQYTLAHAPSAAVNDLKVLDNNAQALQQMDQLLDDGPTEDGEGSPTT